MRCILAALCVGSLAFCGCSKNSLSLDDILLRPFSDIPKTPADYGYQYELRSVEVAPGRSVSTWYIPSVQSKALLVVLSGAGGNKGSYLMAMPALVDAGYDLIYVDYEGFGASPGTPSLEHMVDDTLAVTGYAMTQHRRVGVFGVSLGTALAVRAAAAYDVVAVMLDGVVVLKNQMDSWLTGNPVGGMLTVMGGKAILDTQLPEDYDIVKYIAQAHGAKLIMHAPHDTFTPYSGALQVYDGASQPKFLFPEDYGQHIQMIAFQQGIYGRTVTDWLNMVISQLDATEAAK